MEILTTMVTLQEVPTEISYCICAYGCPLKCKGCSWYGETTHRSFTLEDMERVLTKYKNGIISCICFLGGEWNSDFKDYLELCNKHGFKTCLYTGRDNVEDEDMLAKLDYLKYGHWDASLGGLDSKTTNQVFLNLKTGEKLNNYFWKD